MKNFLRIATLSAAAGVAALSASSAMAAPPAGAASNTVDVYEIQDSFLKNSRAANEAFQSVRGVYAMDDGSILRLYQNGRTYYAEVDGKAPIEVVATKSEKFVSANGATELRFVQNSAGLVANVVLSKPINPVSVAQKTEVKATEAN